EHHSNDDVPRRVNSMPFSSEFAVVLFPHRLLVLPLLLMVFVMLLLVTHGLSPSVEGLLVCRTVSAWAMTTARRYGIGRGRRREQRYAPRKGSTSGSVQTPFHSCC